MIQTYEQFTNSIEMDEGNNPLGTSTEDDIAIQTAIAQVMTDWLQNIHEPDAVGGKFCGMTILDNSCGKAYRFFDLYNCNFRDSEGLQAEDLFNTLNTDARFKKIRRDKYIRFRRNGVKGPIYNIRVRKEIWRQLPQNLRDKWVDRDNEAEWL